MCTHSLPTTLSHAWCEPPYPPLQVRQTAGLLLKNSVRLAFGGISEDFRSFIRAALLPVLGHPSRDLRHTAGTCAVTIVSHTGLGAWPELVAALAEGLGAGPGEPNRVEGALDLLYKVGLRPGGAGRGMRRSFVRLARWFCRVWQLRERRAD